MILAQQHSYGGGLVLRSHLLRATVSPATLCHPKGTPPSPEHAVPVVLHDRLRASRQHLCNLRPRVAMLLVPRHENDLLIIIDGAQPQVGCQVLHVALARLLGVAAAAAWPPQELVEGLGDIGPVLRAVGGDGPGDSRRLGQLGVSWQAGQRSDGPSVYGRAVSAQWMSSEWTSHGRWQHRCIETLQVHESLTCAVNSSACSAQLKPQE